MAGASKFQLLERRALDLSEEVDRLLAALSTARLEGERAGMERAATKADKWASDLGLFADKAPQTIVAEFAAAIRAEKDGLK